MRSHTGSYSMGYFRARSAATIWLRQRQPALNRPGHEALKANWLIALSSPSPVPSLLAESRVKHKWWPDRACTNICRTRS